MSFSCVVKGSFHQGDEQLFPTSKNAQCTSNSACALVWTALGFEFSSTAIDTILIAGDCIYRTLRDQNRMGGNRYLCTDELPAEFSIQGQTVAVEENVFVHDALYPVTEEDISESVISLSNVLESLMAVESQNIGFLFTGQTVTVAFWRSQEQLYLFDPHPVNENRTHDLENDINNLARLFQCDTFPALASLLLSNAALDGSVRQYSITRLTFRSSTFSENIQNLTMHETANNSAIKPKDFGRPKKINGRPKILKTTREEQVREAKKRYSQQNPETNRDAVRRYTEKHPEVNRAAVRRYEDRHAGAGQDRVQVFRLMKPKISEFRHLPNSLARNIVAQGPMAHWSGKLLCDINAYKLKKTCLFEDDIFVCSHCEARLFEEEKDRKKWCCGEGAYNVTRLPPLSAPFYSNRHFLNRARAYNDLFSFCALEIS
ncbi:hypothetical protein J6590_093708, partial [Homalodisca vitripennis]